MRYSEEPCLILARAWRPHSKSIRGEGTARSIGPASPHRSRPAPSRHSRFTPHVGATAAGPPRTPHRAHLAYSTTLKLPLGPRNKKSAQTATFLRLAIVPNSPIANRGIKTQAIDRAAAYYHPAATKKRAPNRKKVAKMPRFLFLRRAKPPQRAELPQRAERNRPNLQIQFHRNGAMVGAHDLGINVGHLHLFTQRFAHQEIVDAPPCVIGAGMEAVAPPGIGAFGCRV